LNKILSQARGQLHIGGHDGAGGPGVPVPEMRLVAAELERILEKEMTLTTVMGDGTAIVTLGSQLFTS
jgi:hypothetical protein